MKVKTDITVSKEPFAFIAKVTPEVANEWLKHNINNRNPKEGRIKRYASDMAKGRWDLNNNSIAFDTNGRLVDGQNRLMACIQSGTSFKTFVHVGLKPKSFVDADSGATRSVADSLKTMGYKNCKITAAVARAVIRYDRTGDAKSISPSVTIEISNKDVIDFIEGNELLGDVVKFVSGNKHRLEGLMPLSIAGAVYYITKREDEKDADYFFDILCEPYGLSRDHPVVRYIEFKKNYDVKMRNNMRGRSQTLILAMIVKTWNRFFNGEFGKKLIFRAGGANAEEFPQFDFGREGLDL